MHLCLRCNYSTMSEPLQIGFRYFLSDSFDNLFKSWASPIKVAFTAGLVIGLGLGYSGRRIRDAATKVASGVHGQLARREDPSQNPIEFKKAEEKMLAMVSPYFPNSNGLFSQLKEYMTNICQTEIEGSSIGELKEAGVPGLMKDYNSKELSVASFYSIIVKFLKEKDALERDNLNQLNIEVNGISRLCFAADILLIYADDNYALAEEVEQYVRRKDTSIRVKLIDDIGTGQPMLSRLDNVFKQYIYVCILVTEELADDRITYYSTEMCHVNAIYNAKGRLIPVLIKGREPNPQKYHALNALKPWKYDAESTNWKQLENLIKNANNTLCLTNK